MASLQDINETYYTAEELTDQEEYEESGIGTESKYNLETMNETLSTQSNDLFTPRSPEIEEIENELQFSQTWKDLEDSVSDWDVDTSSDTDLNENQTLGPIPTFVWNTDRSCEEIKCYMDIEGRPSRVLEVGMILTKGQRRCANIHLFGIPNPYADRNDAIYCHGIVKEHPLALKQEALKATVLQTLEAWKVTEIYANGADDIIAYLQEEEWINKVTELRLLPWADRQYSRAHVKSRKAKFYNWKVPFLQCDVRKYHQGYVGRRITENSTEGQKTKFDHGAHCALYDAYELWYWDTVEKRTLSVLDVQTEHREPSLAEDHKTRKSYQPLQQIASLQRIKNYRAPRQRGQWLHAFMLFMMLINVAGAITAYDCTSPKISEDYALTGAEKCPDAGPSEVYHKRDVYFLYEVPEYKEVMVKECKIVYKDVIFHCGMHSHTSLIYEDKMDQHKEITGPACEKYFSRLMYRDGNWHVDLKVNVTTQAQQMVVGRIYPEDEGDCDGGSYTLKGEVVSGIIVVRHYAITLVEYRALFDIGTGRMVTKGLSQCEIAAGTCYTGESRLNYDSKHNECNLVLLKAVSTQEIAGRVFEGGRANATIQKTQTQRLDYEETPVVLYSDSKAILLIRGQMLVMCDAEVYATNYKSLYVAKQRVVGATKGQTIRARLDMYFNNKIDYAVAAMQRGLREFYYEVVARFCKMHREILQNKILLTYMEPTFSGWLLTEKPGTFGQVAGEVVYFYTCKAVQVQLDEPSTDCTREIAVKYGGEKRYLSPVTKILKENPTKEPCSALVVAKFEVEKGVWISPQTRARVGVPKRFTPMSAIAQPKFIDVAKMHKKGVYSQVQLKAARKALMSTMLRQDMVRQIVNLGSHNMEMPDWRVDGLLTPATVGRAWTRYLAQTWGVLAQVGQVINGLVGIAVILMVVRFAINYVMGAYINYRLAGVGKQLLWACCPLLNKHFLMNTVVSEVNKMKAATSGTNNSSGNNTPKEDEENKIAEVEEGKRETETSLSSNIILDSDYSTTADETATTMSSNIYPSLPRIRHLPRTRPSPWSGSVYDLKNLRSSPSTCSTPIPEMAPISMSKYNLLPGRNKNDFRMSILESQFDRYRVPVIEVEVQGYKIEACIDTGACTNAMDLAQMPKGFEIPEVFPYKGPSLSAVSGNTVPVKGFTVLMVKVGDAIYEVPVVLLKDMSKPLLFGMEFLGRLYGARFDLIKGTLTLEGPLGKRSEHILRKERADEGDLITAAEETYIEPYTAGLITYSMDPCSIGKNVIVEGIRMRDFPEKKRAWMRRDEKKELFEAFRRQIPDQVITAGNPIWYVNNGAERRTIKAGEALGKMYWITDMKDMAPMEDNTEEHKEEETLEEKLAKYKDSPYFEMLQRNRDVFSSHENDFGCTDLVMHHIALTDDKPIHQRAYPCPKQLKSELDKQVKNMLKDGVIKHSTSPWASPVLFVKKKNGKQRLCIDYRKLNAQTKKDRFPLPRISDILSKLGSSKVFSTMDLSKGYYQVMIKPEDREKTAMITQDGLYEFVRMPFGLTGAPSTFQRLMNFIFSGVPFVMVYLDDIIIFSSTVEEHCDHVEEVLCMLRRAKLKANLEKCSFGKRRIEFLGHVITSEGIQPNRDLINKIIDWPVPENRKQLQQFLGLANYYRQFIKGYAKIARPLSKLLGADEDFEWEDEQWLAFKALKTLLTQAPVLIYPKLNEPYILQTDASGYAIGAVLSQIGDDGKEHPIAYISRTLNKHERKYSTTEKECLAVLNACEKFKDYLYRSRVIVVSDHAPLKWLQKQQSTNARLTRWNLKLQELDMEIAYKPGKKHTNADSMSRMTTMRPQRHSMNMLTIRNDFSWDEDSRVRRRKFDTVGSMGDAPTRNVMAKEQSRDDRLKPLLDRPRKPYELHGGVLVRRHREGTQLVIPEHLIPKVLYENHDGLIGGHLGEARTYYRIAHRYYWEGMKRQIMEYVKSCEICQERKSPNKRGVQLLKPLRISGVFERVAMDFLGPLPTTVSGNRWILVLQEYVTKWPMAFALPNERTETFVPVLVEQVFMQYGPPRVLLTDRGPNFVSAMLKAITRHWGIDRSFTTAYHPQTNGMVERLNRTLVQMLASYTSPGQTDWDEFLPYILFAYRTSVHESTGDTPFYLMYGRDPLMPLDIIVQPDPNDKYIEDPEYRMEMQRKMVVARQRAAEHLEGQRIKMQKYYKVNPEKFEEGDLVRLMVPRVKKGTVKKLARLWKGPYRILKVKIPNLLIQHVTIQSDVQYVHANRCKAIKKTKQLDLRKKKTGERDEENPEEREEDELGSTESEVNVSSESLSDADLEEKHDTYHPPSARGSRRSNRSRKVLEGSQQTPVDLRYATGITRSSQGNEELSRRDLFKLKEEQTWSDTSIDSDKELEIRRKRKEFAKKRQPRNTRRLKQQDLKKIYNQPKGRITRYEKNLYKDSWESEDEDTDPLVDEERARLYESRNVDLDLSPERDEEEFRPLLNSTRVNPRNRSRRTSSYASSGSESDTSAWMRKEAKRPPIKPVGKVKAKSKSQIIETQGQPCFTPTETPPGSKSELFDSSSTHCSRSRRLRGRSLSSRTSESDKSTRRKSKVKTPAPSPGKRSGYFQPSYHSRDSESSICSKPRQDTPHVEKSTLRDPNLYDTTLFTDDRTTQLVDSEKDSTLTGSQEELARSEDNTVSRDSSPLRLKIPSSDTWSTVETEKRPKRYTKTKAKNKRKETTLEDEDQTLRPRTRSMTHQDDYSSMSTQSVPVGRQESEVSSGASRPRSRESGTRAPSRHTMSTRSKASTQNIAYMMFLGIFLLLLMVTTAERLEAGGPHPKIDFTPPLGCRTKDINQIYLWDNHSQVFYGYRQVRFLIDKYYASCLEDVQVTIARQEARREQESRLGVGLECAMIKNLTNRMREEWGRSLHIERQTELGAFLRIDEEICSLDVEDCMEIKGRTECRAERWYDDRYRAYHRAIVPILIRDKDATLVLKLRSTHWLPSKKEPLMRMETEIILVQNRNDGPRLQWIDVETTRRHESNSNLDCFGTKAPAGSHLWKMRIGRFYGNSQVRATRTGYFARCDIKYAIPSRDGCPHETGWIRREEPIDPESRLLCQRNAALTAIMERSDMKFIKITTFPPSSVVIRMPFFLCCLTITLCEGQNQCKIRMVTWTTGDLGKVKMLWLQVPRGGLFVLKVNYVDYRTPTEAVVAYDAVAIIFGVVVSEPNKDNESNSKVAHLRMTTEKSQSRRESDKMQTIFIMGVMMVVGRKMI